MSPNPTTSDTAASRPASATDRVGLGQWLRRQQAKGLAEDLCQLLQVTADTCARIAQLVRQAELAGVLGAQGAENVQGEQQKKLDVIANDLMLEATLGTGLLAGLASEEMDTHSPVPDGVARGRYLLTTDPLDGSSNIDVNGSTGTIFSIVPYESADAPTDASFLQPGARQVAAGYCLYSSATMLVLSVGDGVFGFTLDPEAAPGPNQFQLTHPGLGVPAATAEYAINAAYGRLWFDPVVTYVDQCLQGAGGPRGKAYNMRWSGSMVGDVHRVLCRGGVFLYPGDRKLEGRGQAGKLRLLYEANPMGWLVEQAGGRAHTGAGPILELQPEGLHQRVPVLMGSREEIDHLVSLHGR